MTEAEQLIRLAWTYYGGEDDPPPLIVTPQQFVDFKAIGVPEEMMHINWPLPTTNP